MKNFVFMAFAKGTESKEAAEIKRYIGVAPVFVLGVNPNKKELEDFYNTNLESEPEYVGTTDINGETVQNVRIDFIVKTDEEKCGINMVTKVPFFVRNEYRYNKDKSKVQVIDKYGRTAWVTIEQAKAKEIPMYSNGPANLDKDYRPCFVGEEDLTNFIKNYLNIPSVMKYINGSWVMNENPEDSEARLDGIANYFKGDFSELKTIVGLQPNNKVKVMFGVRTTDDNKQYQSVYTQMTLKNSVKDYSKLDADLQERKANGAYATTEFEACDIKEYSIKETDFTETNDVDPFAPTASNPWGL